jgi:phosphatidylglycerophosphatase A
MTHKSLPKPDLGNPVHLLAFGLGSGCVPIAPGTFGTLMAVGLYLPLARLELPWYLAVLALASLAGIWICGRTSKDLGVHDHGGIVWDEFAGFWLTMVAAPPGWAWIVIGFLLFRFFDIVKPWPIRWLDRQVGGGLGIMVDDLLAGLFGLAVMQIAARLLL